jgi:hypothetical protein
MIIDRFPLIKKAALVIAYDSGMINRTETEAEWLGRTESVLASCDDVDLLALDNWLAALTTDEFETVSAGCQDDVETLEILRKCPRGGPDGQLLTKLLDDIFEA